LAEAYTGLSANKITDLGFSYSARGEVTDAYESTPHSGGFFHLNQTYWEHGVPEALSGLPGLPAITYGGTIGTTVGLDGEGRVTQVTADTLLNPVTGVTYNNTDPSTSNEPLGVLLSAILATPTSGPHDSHSFVYDKNSGRITQYTLNINGITDTGTLAWNANGSLQRLAIADSISGTIDSQTCNYTHDDLGRIAGANCGTAWNQTFSYDSFGNITKNGSLTFNPGYVAATNRYVVVDPLGFTGPQYDDNGNLTADPGSSGHRYSWDAEGRLVAIDNKQLKYDALGRMVEQVPTSDTSCANPNNCTQIVYTPTGGKLALMNGQTLGKAFVPLPGGATALYSSSGLTGYRHADYLGSSRLTTGVTYDQGTVSVRVANFTAQVSYNQSSTVTSIVFALETAFSDASSPVSATHLIPSCPPPGPCPPINTLELTSKTNGTSTNYSLSVSSQSNFPGYFSPPSFTPQPSGSTLTGGTDTTPGSGSVQINGTELSASAGTPLGIVAYAPFGEFYASTGILDLSFTDQNQDTASDIYDFMFRGYSSSQGRWISPDPIGIAAVEPMDPQSWNRYDYVGNRPLNSIDPLAGC